MVQSLTQPGFVAADAGAPPLVANLLASLLARTLPKGIEFARYSIDYHYLRNQLFVEERMGPKQAAKHVPAYAAALMRRYDEEMAALRQGGEGGGGGGGSSGASGGGAAGMAAARAWRDTFRELFLLL